jgi:hypothetical protein
MAASSDRLEAESLWTVFTQLGLARLAADVEAPVHRFMIMDIAETAPAHIEPLEKILRGDVRLFTTFLVVAYTKLGGHRYRQAFIEDGVSTVYAKRVIDQLAAMDPLPLPEFKEMVAAFEPLFMPGARRISTPPIAQPPQVSGSVE